MATQNSTATNYFQIVILKAKGKIGSSNLVGLDLIIFALAPGALKFS